MESTGLFLRFGVALFIGILIGLQREHTYEEEEKRAPAGVRTFALMALVGCTAALVADLLDYPAAFVGIVLLLGALIVVSYVLTGQRGEIGSTTEVAAILTILSGALAYWNELAVAVAIGVTTMVLLSFKLELHQLAERISREDILATIKFAIITAIILPVAPSGALGPPPFDVLNPYRIWLMVVLISGISFLGYVMIKIVGARRGIGLTGLLGGLVSSTAVTLSFSQRSRANVALAKPFAMAIIIAWVVMFARVLLEVGVVNSVLLERVWPPIAAAGLVALAYATYLYFAPRADDAEDVTVSNPFELGPAITFGLAYGVILLVARAAQLYVGDAGIYASAIASGLVDVDAITLSMSELSRSGGLSEDVAARSIVLATMSNTVIKGGMVLVIGSLALRRTMLPGFLSVLVVGVSLALLL